MAKHLLKFDTAAEYSAATIVPPAVSWVVSDNEIKNDFYVPTPPVVEYNPDPFGPADDGPADEDEPDPA